MSVRLLGRRDRRRTRATRLTPAILALLAACLLALLLPVASLPAGGDDAPIISADSAGNPADTVLERRIAPFWPRLNWLGRSPWYLPPEFGPQEALLLACTENLVEDPLLLLEIVHAASTRVDVILLVSSAEERAQLTNLLRLAPVPPSRIRVVDLVHDSRWVRDYGPFCALHAEHGLTFLDFDYGQVDDGLGDTRFQDDYVPTGLAARLGRPAVAVPVILDGGNLLTNGDGLGITTVDTLEANELVGVEEEAVTRTLVELFGLERLAYLGVLDDEPTGHADVFMTFAAPNVAVVAEIDPREDLRNARRLDRVADYLRGLDTRYGPMQVHRVPMPLRREGKWRSYTNVVYLNGVLLLPSYRDVEPEVERSVEAKYRELLPGWSVRRIDCTNVIEGYGALRCVTSNIPAAPARPIPPPGLAQGPEPLDPTRGRPRSGGSVATASR